MRYGLLAVMAGIVLVAGMVLAFAQDKPPDDGDPLGGPRPGPERGTDRNRGERMQRPRFMSPPGGSTVAMELSGNTLFLVSGTTVYKVNTSEMKVEAKRDLTDAGQSDKSAIDAVMKRFDADGDGRISQDEWTGPPNKFDRLDGNGDGFVTRDEIPKELLERARKMARKLVTGGPAAIKVATVSLYVYLGGSLYKMKVSDLEIEGSVEIESQDQGMMPKKDRKRQKKGDRGDRPDRPKKKKRDNDDGSGF